MSAGKTLQERYELIEGVGSGGMGEVWLARDLRLDRNVAVKFLSPHNAGDPENLVRFFAEAQSIASLQHPNVVTVLDFGEEEDRPYLVMEHVSGGSLTDVTGEPMMPERALEIIAGIAGASGAAHAIGIVHRDIKPGNILLDDEGNPKLCDFGIASSARAAERLTATGVAVGSPHYISPEQASGTEAVPASDVYSLGVVLYELLTGVRPIEADNVTAMAIAHIEHEPEPPSTHVADLSPALDALVLRCLDKDPARRYRNGHELRGAIDEIHAGGAPDETLVWSGPGTARPPRNRRRVLATAALLGVVTLVAFRGVFPGDDHPAREPTESVNPTDLEDDASDRPNREPDGRNTTTEPAAETTASPSENPDQTEPEERPPASGGSDPEPSPEHTTSVTDEPGPTPTASTDPIPDADEDAVADPEDPLS
jgi:serine/threonine protein kinase